MNIFVISILYTLTIIICYGILRIRYKSTIKIIKNDNWVNEVFDMPKPIEQKLIDQIYGIDILSSIENKEMSCINTLNTLSNASIALDCNSTLISTNSNLNMDLCPKDTQHTILAKEECFKLNIIKKNGLVLNDKRYKTYNSY